eukprot:CAMPEP_0119058436 /NCGR_PEP_ID=MMETSP1178-20130426/2769_1 /TAXON_ID=33656 /ORGANISM="unid sp, Strain CCMP2000" /LENGTH=187 /DNA_ID=CAMNT_0007039371 /DNA_START=47 /DNA_END=611 /DNA_ORIENTATION=-
MVLSLRCHVARWDLDTSLIHLSVTALLLLKHVRWAAARIPLLVLTLGAKWEVDEGHPCALLGRRALPQPHGKRMVAAALRNLRCTLIDEGTASTEQLCTPRVPMVASPEERRFRVATDDVNRCPPIDQQLGAPFLRFDAGPDQRCVLMAVRLIDCCPIVEQQTSAVKLASPARSDQWGPAMLLGGAG